MTKPESKVSDASTIVEAKFVAAQGITGGALPAPTFAEVAFAGRSNVGKSSLINMLVQRKSLVRTSSTPGCTRQVNLFEIRAKDGTALHLADLPGYGFAKRSKQERSEWAKLIEGYLRERATLRALVILFDARRGLEEDDLELIEFAATPRGPSRPPVEIVLAATKIDKLPRSEQKAILGRIAKSISRDTVRKVVGCSAVTGEGREALWAEVRKASHVEAPAVALTDGSAVRGEPA